VATAGTSRTRDPEKGRPDVPGSVRGDITVTIKYAGQNCHQPVRFRAFGVEFSEIGLSVKNEICVCFPLNPAVFWGKENGRN